MIQDLCNPYQQPVSNFIVSSTVIRMVAIGQFCQVEPGFGKVQTSIHGRILRGRWYGFVDNNEWDEDGEVDYSYSGSYHDRHECEGIVALHGRCG